MAEYSYDFEGKENKISAENFKNGLYGKITGYGNSMIPILKSGQSSLIKRTLFFVKLKAIIIYI